ncbi:energy transducer TonB [Pseudemcibacter aquimaris]|uniref:energy transducer TonB n=1 Tax=Pseudemcibacter aquimaris TaxID=2857064 RepID=UPI002011EFD3|nr:energy transducer TonB [Pseudemcibacter aquimaris]MCC3862283.1 energy transducer TonB [Pseudemcibacter aquimaris]WDU59033.1 energy transducer TonB [Pseudemcibacter aquimaris]
MIARYAISFTFAALITFGLFFGMQWLIAMNKVEIGEEEERIRVEMAQVREVQEVREVERKPEAPTEVEAAPEISIDMSSSVDNVSGVGVEISANAMEAAPISTGTGGFSASDGEFLPIVRVNPAYPSRAAENGVEGYVLVEFTVQPDGSTADVIVIESSHKMFERNAVRAAQKYKYKPRVVDGEPVPVTGIRVRIEFKLE